ncbi:MAG: protein kinase [Rickettsiales bacterium]|jgi:serine/threonine protein kinase|nr:protein kinase [Rickettsiales bacterium]
MVPKPATSRDLRNLQEAIKYNPDLFGTLGRELAVDPVRITINRQRVTKLGEGGNGFVYKIRYGGQWKALKIGKNLHQGQISPDSIVRGGDYLVAEAFKEKNSRPKALTNIEYSSPGGKVLVSELCEGGDWSEKRSNDRSLLEANLIPLASALGALHSKNIVHGDVKPENILSDKDECKLFLTDFGCAAKCDPNGFGKNYTGTPNFIAPEMWLNLRSRIDIDLKKCDCWSLGVTFYVKILHEYPCHRFAERYGRQCPKTNEDLAAVSRCIVSDPRGWRNFISSELDRVVPPVGQLLKTALMDLLEPDRSAARSIDEILANLNNLSKINAVNKAEYEKLCKTSNEEVARELELERKREEGRKREEERKKREEERKKQEEEKKKREEERKKQEEELREKQEEGKKKKIDTGDDALPNGIRALQKVCLTVNPPIPAASTIGSSKVTGRGSILSKLEDKSRSRHGMEHTKHMEPQPVKKGADAVRQRFGYKK